MLSDLIIQSDWSDYNVRQSRHIDRFLFNCNEDWEVEYLIEKIKVHGDWPVAEIRDAINLACYEELAPRPRASFIRCVVKILS